MINLTRSTNIQISNALDKLISLGIDFGERLIAAIIILIVGKYVIKWLNKLFARILEKRNIDASIQSFLKSMVNILLLIILILRPYKVGDYLEASNGAAGTVQEIQIFHTILVTVDNKLVYVPNGAMSSGVITNYSHRETRRIEWDFGIDYGEDFEKVKSVLLNIIQNDKRIHTTPEPFIELAQLAASSVNIKVRVWVDADDYWKVFFDMNKNVYSTFNKEGIDFPFPQITVHQQNA